MPMIMALLERQLFIKKSKLPGAGKGLFTNKLIKKGTRIVEYKGRITTWKETSKKDLDNPFVFYVKADHVIDAAPYKKAIARFANDANGINKAKGIINNANYIQDGLRIFIIAKKDIEPGNEILVGYGKEYWDAIRHNIKIKRTKL
jgi:SET domain-containing protein